MSVYTNIIGGLGNQLFQYACGRALAARLGVSVKLVHDMFVGYSLHQGFELQRVFQLSVETATSAELRRVLGWRHPPRLRRLLAKPPLRALRGSRFLAEHAMRFVPEVLTARSPVYLQGYWQSDRYFADQAGQLRSELVFRRPAEGRNKELLSELQEGVSVSLHVRRGDYVTSAANQQIYAPCGTGYYLRGIEVLRKRFSNARFYAFSDDAEWVRTELGPHLPGLQVVDHNRGAESYNDMRLMSACSHHVIANSTFSWWGAWLNPSPTKIVIAPARWFASGQLDDSSIVPADWLKV